ncbi:MULTISPECIES: 6-pyruvoyl tetrahydropterin synthase family protein [Acidianus]|uniref:6-pyruvoyl tetrahydrobiopterin synthase n=1 Tax=Candidatus Acidianus copahuensis TaxID=1160895 RepID=A0A031LST7_9CREN|nr:MULTISPECIES: 6-pyruvoyl tetrahydropterin synthase family protein [Acidianus]EZQ10825.1 6-pyruvoyl tetrahydrobiopterin synthase [Candidatus Acidianus copahuensis]NON63624.1 6-pyruvoyl tetrahydropterin synthase family protein [Acidianus sp. RZ1]
MKVRVGIEGIVIDSAHYTLSSPQDSQLHGHTYVVNVEVEGDINTNTGFVVDFNLLKKSVEEVAKKWDHKFIVPKKDLDKIRIDAPFKNEIISIDAPFPTAEFIGLEIAKNLHEKIGMKIYLKIYEGKYSYAVIEYP